MANVKTAISLDESLFERADAMARRLKVSRSELYSNAMREFLARRENRALFDSINRAVEEDTVTDPEEQLLLSSMRRRHRKLVDGEW